MLCKSLFGFLGFLLILLFEIAPFLNDALSLVEMPEHVLKDGEILSTNSRARFDYRKNLAKVEESARSSFTDFNRLWYGANVLFEALISSPGSMFSAIGSFIGIFRTKVLFLLLGDVLSACAFGFVVKKIRLIFASHAHEAEVARERSWVRGREE